MIKRILIANRGEIAVRIINTCKKSGIETVAVYSEADKESLHVALSDDKICIGDRTAKESYLDIPNVIMASKIKSCDAIHPGYGFLSENAHFAKMCKENSIIFIGPTENNIKMMGDKSEAKKIVERLNVPVIKGFLYVTEENIYQKAEEIGLPIIIKASCGGGGKGMRIVREKKDIMNSFISAKNEAKSAFSNDEVYIEKFIEDPKHIEIQIIADKYGNVYSLGDRDCSIQRNYQKLIEITPSTFIDEQTRKKMCEYACRIAKEIKYEGVGTVEFLVNSKREIFFIEMNTRIQVEHTITEETFGIDLIKEQIEIVQGKKLDNITYSQSGYSIECRINAEDPENNFFPSAGKITKLKLPKGEGLRIDTYIYENYSVLPFYDSLIAKVIVTDKMKDKALRKMDYFLRKIIIEGIKTTIPFHIDMISKEELWKN